MHPSATRRRLVIAAAVAVTSAACGASSPVTTVDRSATTGGSLTPDARAAAEPTTSTIVSSPSTSRPVTLPRPSTIDATTTTTPTTTTRNTLPSDELDLPSSGAGLDSASLGADTIAEIFATETEALAVADADARSNPDPRGPCGAVVPQIPTSGAIAVAYRSSSFVAAEFVLPTSSISAAFVDAQLADVTPGCDGHTSIVPGGAEQDVGAPTFVDLGLAADDWRSVGFVTTISIGFQSVDVIAITIETPSVTWSLSAFGAMADEIALTRALARAFESAIATE